MVDNKIIGEIFAKKNGREDGGGGGEGTKKGKER